MMCLLSTEEEVARGLAVQKEEVTTVVQGPASLDGLCMLMFESSVCSRFRHRLEKYNFFLKNMPLNRLKS